MGIGLFSQITEIGLEVTALGCTRNGSDWILGKKKNSQEEWNRIPGSSGGISICGGVLSLRSCGTEGHGNGNGMTVGADDFVFFQSLCFYEKESKTKLIYIVYIMCVYIYIYTDMSVTSLY